MFIAGIDPGIAVSALAAPVFSSRLAALPQLSGWAWPNILKIAGSTSSGSAGPFGDMLF